MRSMRGVTLIELMVALAVLAVVVALAGPSYNSIITSSRLSGRINETNGLLMLARTEAIKARAPVTLCGTSNVEADPPLCNTASLESGIVIFIDRDGDAVVDGGEDILKRREPLETDLTLRMSDFGLGSGVVRYGLKGTLDVSGNPREGTLVLCADGNEETARALVITRLGTVRLAEDSDGNGIVEGHDADNDGTGDNITCPL